MTDPKYERLAANDPNRCISNTSNGPCQLPKVGETNHCILHGGEVQQVTIEKKQFKAYQVAKWRSKLDHFVADPNVKTLREEIAVARMTLESVLLKCDDESDILIHSGKIQVMLREIGTLVVSCNKLEDRLGLVLDKGAVIILAEQIINIINEYIPVDIAAVVADKISKVIIEAGRVNESDRTTIS